MEGIEPEYKKKDKLFYVKVTSPEGLIFGGNVKAITSVNNQGIFDILSQHTNFITLIKEKLILHKEDGKEEGYKLDKGIIKCANNIVDIYLGI